MHTAEEVPSFRNKGLPPGCALPHMKSLLLDQATKGAGRSLYEILGMAELMRVAYEKGELESLQERLTTLLADAVGLSARLSNILELARLETTSAGSVFEEFDVVALLREAAHRARGLVGGKPVTIMEATSSGPVFIRSDQQKIKQIVTELITNAAKFTERGRITLILNRDKDGLRLMVTDTGKGMGPEESEAFLHNEDREFGGGSRGSETGGLGLKIVRQLVISLNGDISVSSRSGEGTIVQVFIPFFRVLTQAGTCRAQGFDGNSAERFSELRH